MDEATSARPSATRQLPCGTIHRFPDSSIHEKRRTKVTGVAGLRLMVLLVARTHGSNARGRVGLVTSQANEDQLFADIELANSGDSATSKGGSDCDNAAPQIG
jgi:hypothetical protein